MLSTLYPFIIWTFLLDLIDFWKSIFFLFLRFCFTQSILPKGQSKICENIFITKCVFESLRKLTILSGWFLTDLIEDENCHKVNHQINFEKDHFSSQKVFESVSNQDRKSRESGYRQSVILYHDKPADDLQIIPVLLATPYSKTNSHEFQVIFRRMDHVTWSDYKLCSKIPAWPIDYSYFVRNFSGQVLLNAGIFEQGLQSLHVTWPCGGKYDIWSIDYVTATGSIKYWFCTIWYRLYNIVHTSWIGYFWKFWLSV